MKILSTSKCIRQLRQNRPLNSIYPFVFMDAIHYKVKENHQYVTKAAYVVLGINMDGCKDILGIWIGEHESAKFWLNVLNDLKNRGVQSVYVFCVDSLSVLNPLYKTFVFDFVFLRFYSAFPAPLLYLNYTILYLFFHLFLQKNKAPFGTLSTVWIKLYLIFLTKWLHSQYIWKFAYSLTN